MGVIILKAEEIKIENHNFVTSYLTQIICMAYMQSIVVPMSIMLALRAIKKILGKE
jgi:hypothetical protein